MNMSNYSFLKETKVYLVYSGDQYAVEVNNISFNQTFSRNTIAKRTLHNSNNLFEGATINSANPANFELKVYATAEGQANILHTIATSNSLVSFDLYAQTNQDTFKITNCFISNASFDIGRDKPLAISYTGEASRVEKVGDNTYVIPGIPQAYNNNKTYLMPRELTVSIDGVTIDSAYNISVEYQNNIQWLGYKTVQGALDAVDASTSQYPANAYLTDRVLAGSVGIYLRDDNATNLQNWGLATTMQIKAGETIASTFHGFDFNLPHISFTNRLNVSQVFAQNFDWAVTQTPSVVSDIISLT